MITYTEDRIRGGKPTDSLRDKTTLDKALVRFIQHLKWQDVELVGSSPRIITIKSSGMGAVDTTTFDGCILEVRHLHHLAQVIFGLKTEIPTHRVFRDRELWDRIDAMRGPTENRAKAILACMAGVPDDIARTLVARDYKLEEVCIAYALHVEDSSISMLELLQWLYAEA
ncbi:MAG: hypothetical protein QG654_310 [Patescibacteria group bacterium]|nr:hypothetical protein [Patescibacteria group bacterium]